MFKTKESKHAKAGGVRKEAPVREELVCVLWSTRWRQLGDAGCSELRTLFKPEVRNSGRDHHFRLTLPSPPSAPTCCGALLPVVFWALSRPPA